MKTMLALAALAGSLCAATASAEPDVQPRSRTVEYGDLDLATQAGRAKLDRRIFIAVRNACGGASAADLSGQNDVQRCRDAAMKRAVVQRDRIIASALRSPRTRLASQDRTGQD